MAYIVSSSDDALHASMYGMVTREDMSFLQSLSSRISDSSLGEMGNKYLRASREMLDSFNFESLRTKTRALRDRFTRRFDDDSIIPIDSILTVQGARPEMRRRIMAMPRLRDLYLKGRVDGYGERYYDEDPTAHFKQYQPYREVANGSYQPTEEEDRWVTHLGVEDENGIEPLTAYEKVIVRQGWDAINSYLDENEEDPTCMLGSKL